MALRRSVPRLILKYGIIFRNDIERAYGATDTHIMIHVTFYDISCSSCASCLHPTGGTSCG